jgi:hypothetical protein
MRIRLACQRFIPPLLYNHKTNFFPAAKIRATCFLSGRQYVVSAIDKVSAIPVEWQSCLSSRLKLEISAMAGWAACVPAPTEG